MDDESYSWGQKSLNKDYYKDEINLSGQYVSVFHTLYLLLILMSNIFNLFNFRVKNIYQVL